jgi:hypothetical protein
MHVVYQFIDPQFQWGDPDVGGRIILRWILRKWEGVVETGWSWLRIGTGGGTCGYGNELQTLLFPFYLMIKTNELCKFWCGINYKQT